MMAITFTVSDFLPRFSGGGYVMSHVTQTVLQARTFRLETMDGRAGYGEFVGYPALDPAEVVSLENNALADLKAMSLEDIPAFATSLRTTSRHLRGMAFGLETAHQDLIARSADVPLHALLGGRRCDAVPDYLSLSCGDPETMANRIVAEGLNREVIQVKLDGKSVRDDRERIDAVMAVMGPHHLALIDFNGALDVSTADEILRAYADDRIMWEEPCRTYEDNHEVARKTGARLLFDQCLNTLDDFARAATEGGVAAACIKPALFGGLSVARAARDICLEAGIAVRIDGPWCGPVATATALHLAVGAPPEMLISGCDLCEPFEGSGRWGHLIRLPSGRIAPLEAAGHGVDPATPA